MNITGHNSYSGCRFCDIQGIYSNKYRHVYFHPKQKGIILKKIIQIGWHVLMK